MANLIKADCGFDPNAQKMVYEVDPEDMKVEEGYDLKGVTNMHVNLAAETADLEIKDFNNMVSGKMYTIVAANAAQKQLEVKLPASTTLYNGTITKANGMTLVYRFFTDGISIYCQRGVYA